MKDNAIKNAQDEIVFALLRKQTFSVSPRQHSEPKDHARLPIKTDDRDLEAAIDDMIERFPQTLEYLAK